MLQRIEAAGVYRTLDEFGLHDLETVRLILRGGSVIDWHRIDFDARSDAEEFLRVNEFVLDDPRDRERLERIKAGAIDYLRRNYSFPVPKPVERAPVEDLLMMAGGKGHRQLCACIILKVMHIIHHVDGRELLFVLPLSDQEIFHMVEEKVYRVIGSMLAAGLPILEFVGGRKNKDSVYTKLLSKRDTIAAQVYDKLRFRIVTRSPDDIFPVVNYLTRRLFPFNYVIPGESTNKMYEFRRYAERHSRLRTLLPRMQIGPSPNAPNDESTSPDNPFTSDRYQIIHFVVDLPVRLGRQHVEGAPASAVALGQVVFILCELQIIDRETEMKNEMGEASHESYKDRQKMAVMQRLKLGAREPPPKKE